MVQNAPPITVATFRRKKWSKNEVVLRELNVEGEYVYLYTQFRCLIFADASLYLLAKIAAKSFGVRYYYANFRRKNELIPV